MKGSAHAPAIRVNRIIHNMAEYYKERFSLYTPYPHADPFSISSVWVNLSLTKGRSNLSGDYVTMLKESYKGPQFSLLIGHPGEGKTMTMRRVAYDWANGQLADYDLVLAVPLREIQERSDTILDMALAYMQRKNVLKDSDISYLRQCSMVGKPKIKSEAKPEEESTKQLHVLVILDGYDELSSDAQCKELGELLSSQVLPNLDCCVLVTSRPYAVENVLAPVSMLKIEPLDEEQQVKYIMQHFLQESHADLLQHFIIGLHGDQLRGNIKELFDLLQHEEKPVASLSQVIATTTLLLESPSLRELAKTPLLLCYICILGDKVKSTDDSIQLYKLIFDSMVERYETRVGIQRSTDRGQAENIMHEAFKQPFHNICGQSQLIYNLGQMALTGLIGDFPNAPDKLQFTKDDLKKYEIDGDFCTKVGFLNALLDEEIYEFPHKTMQEFIAALLLFHELSKCEEIEVYREDENDSTCPKIKNIDRLFRRHPLLKQVFNTTKYEELNQLLCFLLEMSADNYKNNNHFTHPFPLHVVPLPLPFFNPVDNLLVMSQYLFRRLTGSQETQSRRMSNTINFFLAWTGRNENRIYSMHSMFRPLLKHLSNCSGEAKNYLGYKLLIHCAGLYNSKSLLRHFSTCNVYMVRVDDVCIYIPHLQIIFIVDRNILSHAIPISYEQLKTKCNSTFKMCLIDSTALENLHQVCKAIECKKIKEVKINISSAINQSSILSLEQKLQVDIVNISFEETIVYYTSME